MARRNLMDAEFTYYIGKMYESEKKCVGAPEGNENASKQFRQNGGIEDTPTETADKVAKQFKISPRTVERAEQFSKARDKAASLIYHKVHVPVWITDRLFPVPCSTGNRKHQVIVNAFPPSFIAVMPCTDVNFNLEV